MEFDHSTDTISPDNQTVLTIGGTGALVLPAGTTAQRPAATNGVLRYNSDTQSLDFAINGVFQTIRGATTIAATEITAAGTTQGTATAITAATNNVTTVAASTGVILPVPFAGDEVVVVNNGANALNVYPQSGSTIGDLASNAPSVLAVGRVLTLRAVTATLWEIVSDTGASGGGAVSSVTGTTNQVTVAPTTGATVVSLPSTLIAPGTVQATGSFIAGTNTNSLTSTTGTSMVIEPGAATTTTSIGNTVTVQGGDGGTTSGTGGNVSIVGGTPTSGQGGTVFVAAANGVGTNQSGGNVVITAGDRTGTGTAGVINLVIPATGELQINGTAGTSLQVLTSQGSVLPPVWRTAPGRTYTFGGTGTPTIGNDKTPWIRVMTAGTSVSAAAIAKVAPSGGSFVVSVLRSSDGGTTFPTTVTTLTMTAGTKVTTTTPSTALAVGDLLRLDVTSVNGAADWNVELVAQ